MLAFLADNYGTIIVGAVLLAVVGLILHGMIKDKRAGKGSCGGNCASCGGHCHCQSAAKKSD